MTETETRGQVTISEEAIAELAGHTAMKCYGVVGMDYPTFGSRLRRIFQPGGQAKGIQIELKDNVVGIDLFIVVENGTNIREISRNLTDQITYTVGRHTGLTIKEVNVHISNIKI
jgi:uncharacterized alkaline shock family protein YloU